MTIDYIKNTIKLPHSITRKFINQINITFEKYDIFDIVLDYLGRNGYLDDILDTKIKFKYKKICVYHNYHKSAKNGIIKQTGTKITILESELGAILLKFIVDHKESYIRDDVIVPGTIRDIVIDDYNKSVYLLLK